jgi:release factor glutamine methyltransferase
VRDGSTDGADGGGAEDGGAEGALVRRLRAAGCVFAEDEARLLRGAAGSPVELEAMTIRRVAGEPLEYVLGWVDFRGLRLVVAPGVFVPRTRTGHLVERAVAVAGSSPVVVDLCCGNGAVAAAVAAELGPDRVPAELWASDVDPAAVACARTNLAAYGGRVVEGDLLDPLPDSLRGRVDVLVANTPYVPTDAIALMPPEAREHEARVALDGGPDGLALLRRTAAAAPAWLAPGGHLLVEIAEGQVPAAVAAYESAGLEASVSTSEEYAATVALGRLPDRLAG